ncbi:MAG: hypothetical protein H7177_17900 [Rhizobacter sp.]|nr:hypothetical protein [Bacteriovorax sp.]
MKKLNYFLAFSFVFSFSYFLITKDYKHPSRSIAQAGSPDGDYEIT